MSPRQGTTLEHALLICEQWNDRRDDKYQPALLPDESSQ